MSGKDTSIDPSAMRAFGESVDFGKTARDYATRRTGFPLAFFDLLLARGDIRQGQVALDVGCGTGTIARGLAQHGLTVTGIDPAQPLLDQARHLDRDAGVDVTYYTGAAEALPFDTQSFDIVIAGQCWHWLDRHAAGHEAARVLKPGGRLVIAHFDWLADMSAAGFGHLETAYFDIDQPYSHEAWRGRIRASAGIAASLDPEAVSRFDAALEEMLARDYPQNPLHVPHRVWLATGQLG